MVARAALARIPRIAWGLVAVQLVFIGALLFLLGALFATPREESLRASATLQRIVIDAKTGIITNQVQPEAEKPPGTIPAFDVAPEKGKKPKAPDKQSEKKTPASSPAPAMATKPDIAPETPLNTSAAQPEVRRFALDIAEPLLAPIPRQQASLVMAPAPEVSEQTPEGILPKHSAGKSTPASLYGRPYPWQAAPAQPPVVAILVIGLGMNARSMEAALQLPPEISFSFSPYGEQTPRWVEWARNAGHEAWMDLPTQTEAFPVDDPGPLGIFKPMSQTQVKKNFRTLMLRFTGYVGFALPAAQTALKEHALFDPVVKELEGRGLLLAVPTSDISPATLAYLAPLEKNLILADMLADQEIDENFIRSRLSRLEDQARSKRAAFAVVRAHPMALRLIGEWAKTLPAKKIDLAPVSALPHMPKVKS